MDTLPLKHTKWSDRLAFDVALMLEGSGESLDEVIERIQDFSNATNPNYIEDASHEAETINSLLIKLSDADLINKRKDLSNSITKIIDTLNEMGVEE